MAITAQMARQELARRELARRQGLQQPQQEEPVKQAENGISSIPGDIADLGTNLYMAAGEKAMKLPEEFEQAGQQFMQHPFSAPPRAAQGVLSGLLSGAKGLYNLPLELNTYLGSKGIPPFKQTSGLAEKLKIGNTGLQKLIMGEQKEGDQLWQDVGTILPMFMAPETIAGKIAPKLTERASEIKQFKNLKNKLTGLEEGAEQAGQKVGALNELEENQLAATKAMEQQGNQEVGKHLNVGAEHEARLASGISHRLENIEDYWKTGYKDLKNELKNTEFKMEKLPEYSNDMQHAIKNIKDLEVVNGKLVIKNQPEVSQELQHIIEKAPTPKDIKADDFLSKYQDFRDARYDLLQRAKTADTASERKALFKTYEDSKPIEAAVSKALHEGLGEHGAEFGRINRGYSSEVYPLRSNKVAKKALSGKVGPNTLEDLIGTGEGQELMREIVKQDPELLRNIVGQRYAAKPQNLKELNETTAEYLYEMPELKKIMKENETKLQSELNKVEHLKSQKNINLKQKLDYEHKATELKKRLERIEKDRAKIWKGIKTTAKVTTGLALGAPLITSAYKKFIGD